MTIQLTKEKVRDGKIIISGLAKGIDSYAHTACLKNGGATISVRGNGVDICYPSEHRGLLEEVTKNGLTVIEYPPGTLPRSYQFPKRNRIIAALSDELYVIGAGNNSGTRSTAEAAERMKKKVIFVNEK